VITYDFRSNVVRAIDLTKREDALANAAIAQLSDMLRSLNVFLEILSNSLAECTSNNVRGSPVGQLLGGPGIGEAVRTCMISILTIPQDNLIVPLFNLESLPAELEDLYQIGEILQGMLSTTVSLLCNLSNIVSLGSVGFALWREFTEALCRDLSLSLTPPPPPFPHKHTVHSTTATRMESLTQLCLDVALSETGAAAVCALPRPMSDVLMTVVATPTARWVSPRVRTMLVTLVGICIQRGDMTLFADAAKLLKSMLACPILPVAWESADVLMDMFSDETHDASIAFPGGVFVAMQEFQKLAPVRGEEWDDDELDRMRQTALNLKAFIKYKKDVHKALS